jgi:hypothetical protein
MRSGGDLLPKSRFAPRSVKTLSFQCLIKADAIANAKLRPINIAASDAGAFQSTGGKVKPPTGLGVSALCRKDAAHNPNDTIAIGVLIQVKMDGVASCS